jgi:hypothetical protein
MNRVPQRERGDAKTVRVPARRVIEIKLATTLAKPDWMRVRAICRCAVTCRRLRSEHSKPSRAKWGLHA